MGNSYLGMICCGDNANKRMKQESKQGEINQKGQYGEKGKGTKETYIKENSLNADKVIEGRCATDDELCTFVQSHISNTFQSSSQSSNLEGIIVISPNTSAAYRLPNQEASNTGVGMLSELIRANGKTLRIVHLNGHKLDEERAPTLVKALMECAQLEIIDLYDCNLNRDSASFIFNNLKDLPQMREMILSGNDINAKTRLQISEVLENDYKQLKVIF